MHGPLNVKCVMQFSSQFENYAKFFVDELFVRDIFTATKSAVDRHVRMYQRDSNWKNFSEIWYWGL